MSIQEQDRGSVSGDFVPDILVMPLADAARIFSAVGMFASDGKETRLSAMAQIRVESVDGKLGIVATDSYALGRFVATDWEYTGAPFGLPAATIVKTLTGYAKTCKKATRYGDEIMLQIKVTGSGYLATCGGWVTGGDIEGAQFPPYRALLVDNTGKNVTPFDYVGFGIPELVRLGKAAKAFNANAPMVMEHYSSAAKPVIFTQTDTAGVLTVLQMPIRVTVR